MNFSLSFFFACMRESLKGIPYTLMITALSMGAALVVGYIFAQWRRHRTPVLSQFVAVYVSFIRGTPIVAQLYLIYFALPMALQSLIADRFGVRVNFYEMPPVVFALIVFSMNAITGTTEILRSALSSVDQGQMEACLSCGMTARQANIRVVIPQAMRAAFPSLINQATNTLKSTSLAMAVSVAEITSRGKTYASMSFRYLECFLGLLIIYFFLNFVVERALLLLERRGSW